MTGIQKFPIKIWNIIWFDLLIGPQTTFYDLRHVAVIRDKKSYLFNKYISGKSAAFLIYFL
ncbi:hypothetical protein A9970_07120 [Sphingobacterium sp. UME9]|nr:hypothetical protein [Sphingobacterium sp. UME9]